ncbi:MAG TPA: anthranilate synthase component I family protein [Pirellulaceae bacterium]|nr:anthranilate synthase component I family protein [Pirellulaceae bacterium]
MTAAGLAELPLAVELRPAPDVESAFVRLAFRPHSLFLDSALRDPRLGRYSFLTADPFELFIVSADQTDGLRQLGDRLRSWPATTRPGLPPFQGGAAGLLSYDLARSLERIPTPRVDEFKIPTMAIGLYDTVLAFDHAEHRAWLISQGFPETNPASRLRRATRRIEQFQDWLQAAAPPSSRKTSGEVRTLAVSELAPQFVVPGPPGLSSNFSADGYRAAVQRAIDYIYAGDVFQVNLAQRLLFPAAGDAISLYLRLRQCNPAPFSGWFDLGDAQIVSASPERFLSVCNGRVEARPIKGTRRRTAWAEADLFAGDDLLASEKDRAENVMIVDLLRNDLSRVCEADSVRVTQLCSLESYQFVQHLVSAVEGTLAPGKTAIDLVRAAFPGGSITGAPKIRAMEIIAELEPTARGPYCGCLGYFGFDGSMDLNILIRTITASRGWWQFPVGGGIVAQSSPEREYEETWHKAEGLLRALR